MSRINLNGLLFTGFGETPSYSGDRGDFLDEIIGSLCGDVKPVLVSPSMSGSFSLPLIEKNQGSAYAFSSMFILDVAT